MVDVNSLYFRPDAEITKDRTTSVVKQLSENIDSLKFNIESPEGLITDIDSTVEDTDKLIKKIDDKFIDYKIKVPDTELTEELSIALKRLDPASEGRSIRYSTYKKAIEDIVEFENIDYTPIVGELTNDPDVNSVRVGEYLKDNYSDLMRRGLDNQRLITYTTNYFNSTDEVGTQGLEALPDLYKNKVSLKNNKKLLLRYSERGYDLNPQIGGSTRLSLDSFNDYNEVIENTLNGYYNDGEVNDMVSWASGKDKKSLKALKYLFKAKRRAIVKDNFNVKRAGDVISAGVDIANNGLLASKDGVTQLLGKSGIKFGIPSFSLPNLPNIQLPNVKIPRNMNLKNTIGKFEGAISDFAAYSSKEGVAHDIFQSPVVQEVSALANSAFKEMQSEVKTMTQGFVKQQMLSMNRSNENLVKIQSCGKLKSIEKVVSTVLTSKVSGLVPDVGNIPTGVIQNVSKSIGRI